MFFEWRASGYEIPKLADIGMWRVKGKFGRPPKQYRLAKWPVAGPYDWKNPSPGVLLGRDKHKHAVAADGLPVLVLGPTGAGKTRHFIPPNIARWPGPVTATSVKTDLINLTAPARRSKGRVYGFEPSGRLCDEMIGKGITPVVWDPVRLLAGGHTSGGVSEWKQLQLSAAAARAAGDRAKAAQHARLAAAKRAATLKEDSDLLGQFLASQSSSHGGGSQGLWAHQAGRTISDALLVAVLAKR